MTVIYTRKSTFRAQLAAVKSRLPRRREAVADTASTQAGTSFACAVAESCGPIEVATSTTRCSRNAPIRERTYLRHDDGLDACWSDQNRDIVLGGPLKFRSCFVSQNVVRSWSGG